MITARESLFLGLCIEGYFFGLYSAVFAKYCKCRLTDSRPTTILFYALLILYILCTATIVADMVALILESRYRTLPLQKQLDSHLMIYRLFITQSIASGCSDFLAQCILIYRCWIVWGQNIYVVILPFFMAIVHVATWYTSDAGFTYDSEGYFSSAIWTPPVVMTSLAASMAVNTLVTGLMVFKILRVFLDLKANSDERTFGSLSSNSGGRLRRVIFVIIESGMALFVVQFIRIVLDNVGDAEQRQRSVNFMSPINQMFNGITPTIILVRSSMTFDDEESLKKTVGSLLHFTSESKSDSSTLSQGSNDDIYK